MTQPSQDQISFHEATIIDITHVGATANVQLDDVFINGAQRSVEVTIENVESILRNEKPISNLRMEKADGEVLTLKMESDQVVLVLQWNDFIARSHEIVAYDFKGPKVALRLTHIGADSSS